MKKWLIGGLCIALVLVMAIQLLPVFFNWLGDALEAEHQARRDPGRAALTAVGLGDYAQYAPWYYLEVGGALTVFVLDRYDNYTDKNDLRAGVMAHAAASPDWHVEAVTAEQYAAMLHEHFPEAAFMIPANTTFDAWYQAEDAAAFFDQDAGLMVYWRADVQPHAGSIRADGLKVPHNGFVYEMETHGGFLGDGQTFQALIVPEDRRAALEEALASHADWHKGTIPHDEYVLMQDHRFFSVPELYPSADVDFEWWCYVDTYARAHPGDPDTRSRSSDFFPAAMQEAGAIWSMNWLAALYDADTGLFIYYEYDS